MLYLLKGYIVKDQFEMWVKLKSGLIGRAGKLCEDTVVL